jgi:hypothetical protein
MTIISKYGRVAKQVHGEAGDARNRVAPVFRAVFSESVLNCPLNVIRIIS